MVGDQSSLPMSWCDPLVLLRRSFFTLPSLPASYHCRARASTTAKPETPVTEPSIAMCSRKPSALLSRPLEVSEIHNCFRSFLPFFAQLWIRHQLPLPFPIFCWKLFFHVARSCDIWHLNCFLFPIAAAIQSVFFSTFCLTAFT